MKEPEKRISPCDGSGVDTIPKPDGLGHRSTDENAELLSNTFGQHSTTPDCCLMSVRQYRLFTIGRGPRPRPAFRLVWQFRFDDAAPLRCVIEFA
jgi:hypothetical protein